MKSKLIFKVFMISVIATSLIALCLGVSALAADGEAQVSNLVGDVDLDTEYTIKDLITFRQYFANFDYDEGNEMTLQNGDLTGDGVIDILDLNAMRNHFANESIYEYYAQEHLNLKHTLRVREDGSFRVLILSDVQ